MKKLFAFTAVLLVSMFASCTDEDVAPVITTEEVYVTQMVENNGGAVTTYTYTYDGNKLMSVTDTQGFERQYSYVNDLLVKEEVYLNGELTEYTILSYKANKMLAQATHITDNGDGTWSGIRTALDHNNDGTIGTLIYQGNEEGQYDFIASGMLTYSGGNITSYSLTAEDEDDEDDIEPLPVVTVFAYDTGKAPFKNIFGYEGLLVLAKLEGGINTLASAETTVIIPATEEGGQDEEVITTVNHTYQYNENSYPTQETTGNITRQYTYN
jgi:hypothetical protein